MIAKLIVWLVAWFGIVLVCAVVFVVAVGRFRHRQRVKWVPGPQGKVIAPTRAELKAARKMYPESDDDEKPDYSGPVHPFSL